VSVVVGAAVPAAVCRRGVCPCCPGVGRCLWVIFVSDNGGPTHGDEETNSNNYPMRGGKNTLWEGGTRVAACGLTRAVLVWGGVSQG